MWPVQYLLLNGQWYQLGSPWLVFETRHHFLKGYEGSDGWKFLRSPSSTIPFPFICSAGGVRFFFPQQFYCTPPQKKNNPELLCVNGDCIAALFIGTSITIQGSDFPQAAWKFPRDSQREIPPVVGSYSEQHQAALQKRGAWSCGSFGVNFTGVKHQIRGFACSLALVHVQIQGSLTKSSAIYTDRLA